MLGWSERGSCQSAKVCFVVNDDPIFFKAVFEITDVIQALPFAKYSTGNSVTFLKHLSDVLIPMTRKGSFWPAMEAQ